MVFLIFLKNSVSIIITNIRIHIPKIYLLSNPRNNGPDQNAWLLQNCPGGWIKASDLGKGFQLNGELTKAGWLYNTINLPQSGNYVRCGAEIVGGVLPLRMVAKSSR